MGVTIQDIRKSGAAARAYHWDVQIDTGNVDAKKFNVRCQTSGQPNPSVNDIPIEIRAYTLHEAGGVDWSPISFTVIETVDFQMLLDLYGWMTLEFNPETSVQEEEYAAPHSKTSDVKIMMNSLANDPVVTWALHGCVLTGAITLTDLASDKTSIHNLSFEVSYAYATLE